MPIKFRCQHCQQLMGISRKKVGQVVDCPKCGRSVRVPIEDGVSQPAPEPEWNLEDPALAKALDELAAIGKKTDGTQPPAATPPAPAPTPPAPIVPPTPLVVKAPPKPVEPEKPAPPPYTPPAPQSYSPPLKNVDHQESIAGSWYIPDASESESDEAPAATPTPAAPAYSAPAPSYSPPAASPSFTPFSIPQATAAAPTYQPNPVGGLGASSSRPSEPVTLGALAELASRPAAIPTRPTRATPAAPSAPKSTSIIVVVLVTMLTTGLVGLGIAYAVGLFSGGQAQNTVAPGTPEDGEGSSVATDEVPVPKNVAVSGRVTYFNDAGKEKPDVGARVLVLPIERNGAVKLPSSGLGPLDGKSDFLVRLKSIREVGGDAAIVNDDGSYELRLPGSAGDFQVIAVSKHQGREGDVPESIEKIMNQYFEEDSHILSKRACSDKRLRYNGKEKEICDFDFPSP